MREVNVGLESVLNTYYSYIGCKQCNLCAQRPSQDVLAGVGSVTADIVIIGEAPSEFDMNSRELFADNEGRMLLNMLEMVWYEDDMEMNSIRDIPDKEEYFDELRKYLLSKIFFTCVTACPTKDGMKVNKTQADACKQRVFDLIYAIDPLIVVGLGDVPGKYIFNIGNKVAYNRGILQDFKIKSKFSNREIRYPGMIIYSPKVLGRVGDQNLVDKEQGLTYETMQDLKKVLEIVRTHKELHNDSRR